MILLDCLTLWVSNLLLNGPDPHSSRHDILPEVGRLLELPRSGDASWIVVSNEAGLGVVPATQLGRIYADELGRVNQLVAAEADEFYLVAAGLPVTIKTYRHGERAAHGLAGNRANFAAPGSMAHMHPSWHQHTSLSYPSLVSDIVLTLINPYRSLLNRGTTTKGNSVGLTGHLHQFTRTYLGNRKKVRRSWPTV